MHHKPAMKELFPDKFGPFLDKLERYRPCLEGSVNLCFDFAICENTGGVTFTTAKQMTINMEVDDMRELKIGELGCVAGGEDTCTPDNSYGGINDTTTVAEDFINMYEGAVSVMSHIIERVALAL